jgi:hypothetical protein
MRRTAVAIAALLLAAGTTPAFAGAGLPKVASIEVGPHRASLHNDSPSLLTGTNTLTLEIADLAADHRVSLTLVGPRGEQIGVPLSTVIVLAGPDGGHGGEADSHAAAPADDHGAKSDDHAVKPDDHGTAVRDPHGTTVGHGTVAAIAPAAKNDHAASTPKDDHSTPVQAKVTPVVDAHAARPAAEAHGAAAKDDHASPASAAHDEPADAAHGDATTEYMARGSVSLPSTGTWTARLAIRDAHGEEMVGETQIQVSEGGPNRLYLGITGSLIFGSMLFGLIQRRRPSRPLSTTKDRN